MPYDTQKAWEYIQFAILYLKLANGQSTGFLNKSEDELFDRIEEIILELEDLP